MTDRLYYGSTLPKHRIVGMTSMVGARGRRSGRECRHVPLLDVDSRDIESVRAWVSYGQSRFGLGSAYIWETRKGYHVWFLDVMGWRDAAWVLARLPVEARDHAVMGAATGYWTLRLSSKGSSRIRFREWIPREGRYPLSRAHGALAERLSGLDVLEGGGEWVGGRRLVLVRYRTPRRQPL